MEFIPENEEATLGSPEGRGYQHITPFWAPSVGQL